LKPMLQRNWHIDFDECGLSYFDAHGKSVKVKKMKHLLQALLQWREERLVCSRGKKLTELDETLQPLLELVPSKKHNDLLLRCVLPKKPQATVCLPSGICHNHNQVGKEQGAVGQSTPRGTSEGSIASREPIDLSHEIALLRAENESLRAKNIGLGHIVNEQSLLSKGSNYVDIDIDFWDNPSEPPPFEYRGCMSTPCSTATPSDIRSGDVTPFHIASRSQSCTPAGASASWVWDGQRGQLCPMVPMFYVVGDRDLNGVPNGVVQQALSIFESHKTLPSFFTMGARGD